MKPPSTSQLPNSKMPAKVAIVCDFLTTLGGAENVVLAMHEAFPEAPVYTAIYNKEKMPTFREIDVRTSRLQKLPKLVRQYHKLFPTLAVNAMRKLDLDEFDIILRQAVLFQHALQHGILEAGDRKTDFLALQILEALDWPVRQHCYGVCQVR